MLSLIPGIGPFLSIGSFFASNWKLMLSIGGAIALSLFVYSWVERGKDVIRQQDANAVLQSDIKVLQTEKDLLAHAVQVAQDQLKLQQGINNDVANIQRQIEVSPSQKCDADPSFGIAVTGISRLRRK